MRLAAALVVVPLVLTACRDEVPVPVPPPKPPTAPPAVATPVAPAPTTPTPGTAPPAPERIDLKEALDHYVGFSSDGLAFASSEYSSGAGLPILTVISSTTGTVEKTVPLDSMDTRRRLVAELAEDGFPPPGTREPIPSEITAQIDAGQVVVRFGPVPAARPIKPFAGMQGITPTKVDVVAVSKDGKRVALRISGQGGGEFGPPVEHRVVELFK